MNVSLGQTEPSATQLSFVNTGWNTSANVSISSGTIDQFTILTTGNYYIECGFNFEFISSSSTQSNGAFFKLVPSTNVNSYFSFGRSRIQNSNSHLGSAKLYFAGNIQGGTILEVYGFKVNNNQTIGVYSGNIFISEITP
jgi:hypothetical protein